MTCDACEIAEKNAHTGRFNGDCLSCAARSIAQSPQAHKRESDPSELQGLMRRIWIDKATHQRGRALVWEWIQRLEQARPTRSSSALFNE
jgi:hypothetical protein